LLQAVRRRPPIDSSSAWDKPRIRGKGNVLVRATLISLLLLPLVAACGDGVIFFQLNTTGTVVSDADCHGSGGDFPLRNQQGLVLLVIINSDTVIFLSNGLHGGCRDITAGAPVQVRGVEEKSEITASQVDLR